MITIDADIITVRDGDGGCVQHHIGSPEGFALVSRLWLRSGWDNKHVYSFTWLGRPIIQLPEDLVRLQELVYAIKPDVIVETGIAHGGSLVFYAGLCKLMGRGRVIGVDVEIRPHNRAAIESHELATHITMIEGSSIDPTIVANVRRHIAPDDRVVVILDSCHTKAHVLAELNAYAPLVSNGSYMVAMDGIMQEVAAFGPHVPRTRPDWTWNNPQQAVRAFLESNQDFELVEPAFAFNEGSITQRVTYSPNGIVRRVRGGST